MLKMYSRGKEANSNNQDQNREKVAQVYFFFKKPLLSLIIIFLNRVTISQCQNVEKMLLRKAWMRIEYCIKQQSINSPRIK